MSRSVVLPRVLSSFGVLAMLGTGIGALAGCGGGSSKARRGVPERRQALAVEEREADRGEKDGAETGGPAAELVGDRAWPRSYVETKRALAARSAFRSHPQRLSRSDFRQGAAVKSASVALTTSWQELGPITPDVPGLVTYTGRATTNSGRVTALVVSPACSPGACRLWVAAAGGGVWRTDDALATTVTWTPISSGMASNAIGSLALDPNDGTHQTIYAGTGEPNGSGDSEAGVGLYRSTDGGDHWTLVPGSTTGVATDRSIGAIAIDPGNLNHILIGTAVARHGSSSANGGRRTPPGAPTLGVWESINGGATFTLAFSQPPNANLPAEGLDWFQGGVNRMELDPNHPSVVYVALFGYGIWRRGDTNDADTTTFHQVFATKFPADETGDRTEFALADTGADTRIYAGDSSDGANGGDGYAALSRVNIAGVASTTLTNGTTNAGWTLLSDPATPDGQTSNGYCQNGQCGYDNVVAVEPGDPDHPWLAGSMQYSDLGGGASNGRAVVRSTDAGVTFRDMTDDAQSPPEGLHPDIHAIAFAPDAPGAPIAFIGSDGGVERITGPYNADDSARCATLTPPLGLLALGTCQRLLTNGPTTLESLNDGLATIQFQSLTVNPAAPTTDVMGGTQDNGTWAWSGSSWFESVGGDGGQSAIDVGNPSIRMHTYFGASGDVNFHGMDPSTWLYVTGPLDASSDAVSFYMPFIGDPAVASTVFAGMSHVWRTKDNGGTEAQLTSQCPEPTALFGDPGCGDWVPLGADLTSTAFGADRAGQFIVSLARALGDSDTLWAATRTGRLFVTPNASAPAGHVTFDRIDTPATPGRFVSDIVVDPSDAHHAWISYSGYGAYTPGTAQHVIEARYDPASGSATFTDLSYDLGDAPITGLARDGDDLYAATDFGALRLPSGATAWAQAGSGLPPVAVYGITIDHGSHLLYAATHGRGAWRIQLPVPPAATPTPTPAPSTPAATTPTETTPTTTTPATTTPTPPPTVKKKVSPAPFLVGRTVRRAADGRAPIVLRCAASGARCSGTLRLLAGLSGGTIAQLGSAHYSIRPGARSTVRVRVGTGRFASLRDRRRLRLTARVVRTGSPFNVTLGSVVLRR